MPDCEYEVQFSLRVSPDTLTDGVVSIDGSDPDKLIIKDATAVDAGSYTVEIVASAGDLVDESLSFPLTI